MTRDPPSPPWEFVFVRHVVESKRDDFERVSPMIQPPFESNSSSSSSGIDALTGFTRPSHRWMIAAHFTKLSWIPLYCNAASPREIFEANKESRRMEIVWLGRKPDESKMFFYLTSARTPVIQFSATNEEPSRWKQDSLCGDADLDVSLKQCQSGSAAFERLCQRFSVPFPAPWIHATAAKFEVVGVSGKPISSGMKNYLVFSASGLAPGESDASERLAHGIERGKPKIVQAAIDDGARLDVLPETSLTPLVSALFKCGKNRKWRQCAQAIIDAGYPVDGDERRGSPIFDACEHFVPEKMTIGILEFLIANGVDINLPGSGGLTVLDTSACRRRENVVRFLLENGADPHLLTRGDKSIVDEIRTRVDKELRYKPASEYDNVLKLLTGQY